MANKEAHRLMNLFVGQQMIIINHQINRAIQRRQLDKKLRKQGAKVGILPFLRHRFTAHAVIAGGLLNRSHQIAGEALGVVVALIE